MDVCNVLGCRGGFHTTRLARRQPRSEMEEAADGRLAEASERQS